MNNADASTRIEALEVRVAYQDQTIEDLNKTISAQWSEIDILKRRIDELVDRMREVENTRGENQPEPPPPHY